MKYKQKPIHHHFKQIILFLLLVVCFMLPLPGAENIPAKEEKKQESRGSLPEQAPIIEEVEVTARVPAQQPVSTVSLIEVPTLMKMVPKHLGEVMNFTSGTYVTDGGKGEFSLMIRGIADNRITLMYDGIPIAEPYFNSFDLKTFSSSGVESIKVIKGAGSVLYGPNTLGGVINVVSRRPAQPFLSLDANFSENNTYFVSGSGGYVWDRFSFFANALWDKSDGFSLKQNDQRQVRDASDYDRKQLTAKLYFYPAKESEIMAEVIYYNSSYGIPAALDYLKARYWDFKDWDRLQVNLGGVFPFLKDGMLKTRFYYINHYNILDAFTTPAFDSQQWESTYKNKTYGASLMGQKSLFKGNELKLSMNLMLHRLRQQGDIGEEWEVYNRDIYSLGVEDHLSISPRWKLIAGASVDHLKKNSGETKTTVNPIAGIRFTPREWLSFHLSLARKSRFPSMRSLYGSKTGNPDLRDETGSTMELGFTHGRDIFLSGAVFYSRYDDLIQSYRGLDGYKAYQNVGRAEIYGFELEARKTIGIFNVNVNYTYLDARDKDTDSPLDYTPKSQFNMLLNVGPVQGFTLSFWGLAVSSSEAKLGSSPPFDVIEVPGYVLLNARLEKRLSMVTLYVKAENLLDKQYFTEPGYPMKARTFSVGFNVNIE